jgi:hypothetical protein
MPHVLVDAHVKLRRGEFDQQLHDLICANRDTWNSLDDEQERLKANYVVAEVFDYFGDYAHAFECLQKTGPEQLEKLKNRNGNAGRDRDLFKRRVWLAIAYAMSLYRSDKFESCIDVLDTCRLAIDDIDAGRKALFGTRARLAHTGARAARQLHRHEEARRGFYEAMVFARKRFVAKTPWAEQSNLESPPFGNTAERRDQFEQHRLLCHWTIGRCLAPGLGYVDYTTGRLSSADTLLSAGYGLLRGTGDVIQRAYAVLLMGAVGRARAGDDLAELEDAIALLQDAANVLKLHPTLTLRASYELALAYYKSPKWRARASDEIRTLKSRAKDNPRWMSSALVVESRVERLNGRAEQARNCAEQAVDRAKAAADTHSEILAEALIALGEACASEADQFDKRKQAEDARESRRAAVQHLADALEQRGSNPKIAAVCNLHLAMCHVAQGALLEAHRRREAAAPHLHNVEHGFVIGLAESVDKLLARSGLYVLDVRRESLNKDDQIAKLEAFLITQALAMSESPARAAEVLGMEPGGMWRAVKRLCEGGYLPKDVEEARRPPRGRHRARAKKG